jgi:hypothetical protein
MYYTPSRSLKASPSPKRKSPKRKSPKKSTNNAIMKFFGSVLGARVKGAVKHTRRSY